MIADEVFVYDWWSWYQKYPACLKNLGNEHFIMVSFITALQPIIYGVINDL